MNQDSMDNKIKNSFDSLDEQDLSIARDAKERIWSKVEPKKQKKKGNQWWLLLLLGGLLFTAGWFLSPSQTIESTPNLPDKAPAQLSPDSALQMALIETKSFLNIKQLTLDSLQALNVSLSERLLVMSQNKDRGLDQQLEKRSTIIRDTIYLTQVKVEQKIIEKIIRDTIFLEIPSIQVNDEPMADVGEKLSKEQTAEEPIDEKSTLPSSVQFNFSETNHIDK